jgi:hypothetical protein
MSSSMLYTMGMAISRAQDLGFDVAVLVEGQWIQGTIAAQDGVGLVLEHDMAEHSVVRMESIAAVRIMSESPYRQELTATGAMPMPGPRAS